MSYQERALAIIDRLTDSKIINIRERGILRRAILLTERPTGEWIEETDEHLKGMYRCSVCGRRVEDLTDDVKKFAVGWEDCTVADIYPYCHCGADMRKETENGI